MWGRKSSTDVSYDGRWSLKPLAKKTPEGNLVRELEILGGIFDEADKDHSGTIDRDEFLQIVAQLSVEDEDPGATFDRLDSDNNGELDFDEMRGWLAVAAGEKKAEDAKSPTSPRDYRQPSVRVALNTTLPSKQGWITRAEREFCPKAEQMYGVLDGQDEVLRLYYPRTKEHAEAAQAAEQAAAEEAKKAGDTTQSAALGNDEPADQLSLHHEKVEIVPVDAFSLELHYVIANRFIYCVELSCDSADEMQEWWAAFTQVSDSTRRLELQPTDVALPETSTWMFFCGPTATSNEEKIATAGEVVGSSVVPGFDLVRSASGKVSMEPHMWHVARMAYDKVLNLVIRPPRASYQLSQLGPRSFPFWGKQVTRNDFVVTNQRGQRVMCSQWSFVSSDGNPLVGPAVIYLHGNASCRLEALKQLTPLLLLGLSVVAIDTAGSGLSDGEYVSLGLYEQHDVLAVANHLRDYRKATKVAVWGRSMGAVTSLLYASQMDPNVACVVVDSPFKSLDAMCRDLIGRAVKSSGGFKSFLADQAIGMVDKSVKYRAGFRIREVNPLSHMAVCRAPVFFLWGRQDQMISPSHSEELLAACSSPIKKSLAVEGGHNDLRPFKSVEDVAGFLSRNLLDSEEELPVDFTNARTALKALVGLASLVEHIAKKHPWAGPDGGQDMPVGQIKAIRLRIKHFKCSKADFFVNPMTEVPWVFAKLYDDIAKPLADLPSAKAHAMAPEMAQKLFLHILERAEAAHAAAEFNSGMTNERAAAAHQAVGNLLGAGGSGGGGAAQS